MSASAVPAARAGPLVTARSEPPATSANRPWAHRERNAARVVSIVVLLLGRVPARHDSFGRAARAVRQARRGTLARTFQGRPANTARQGQGRRALGTDGPAMKLD